MKKLFLLVLCGIQAACLLFSPTYSQAAQVYEWEVNPQTKLKVNLDKVKITFKEAPQKKFKMSWMNSDNSGVSLLVLREGDVYKISSSSFSSDTPVFNLEITGASLPTELAVKSGQIQISTWSKKIDYKCVDCKVNVQNMSGELAGYQLFGDFKAETNTGRMDLDFFSVATNISKSTSDVEIKKFKSDLSVSEVDGNVTVQEGFGVSKITKVGRVIINNQKGQVSANNVKDKVETVNAEGSVSLQIGEQKETLVKNGKGKVSFSDYAGKGILVDAKVDDGELYTPNEIKVYRLGTQKIARGPLKGTSKGQMIRVRSTEGLIQFR